MISTRRLAKMTELESVHPKLRGHAVRLLRDAAHLDDDTVARHLGFALSPGMPAISAAAWLEGFLQGGGSLLVHDRALLGLVDAWLASLGPEVFQATLPLLRRTFGTFSPPERTAHRRFGRARDGSRAGRRGSAGSRSHPRPARCRGGGETARTAPTLMNDSERLRRWRLVLGSEPAASLGVSLVRRRRAHG